MKQCITVLAFLLYVWGGDLTAQTPALRWAKSIGGTSTDQGNNITLDASGNSYVLGMFGSTSLTIGSTTLTNGGLSDVFFVKYDPNGNMVWAKSGSGASSDYGGGVAVDASGNSYITGYYASTTLIFGALSLTNSGLEDLFLVKYDRNGNVVWAKRAGGTGNDYGQGVSIDSAGNVYLTGTFFSPTITFGSTTLTSTGGGDFFLVKYDPNGNVIWAKSAGGTGDDWSQKVAVDFSGNSYVTGYWSSPTLTIGSTTLTNGGDGDIFFAKYDPNGNPVLAKSYGSIYWDYSNCIAVDSSKNIYLTGDFYSPSITFGLTTLTKVGNQNMWVLKCDSAGNVLWVKGASGSGYNTAFGLSLDVSGNIFVTGYFGGSATLGSITLPFGGLNDIFVAKYDKNGTVVWAKGIGGTGDDWGGSIATDGAGNCYTTGYYSSTSMTIDTTTLTSAGSYDMYVLKLDGDPPLLVAAQDVPNDQGGRVMLRWKAAGIDKTLENTTGYSIWRALSPGQVPSIIASTKTIVTDNAGRQYRQFPLHGVNYYWEWVANQPAHLLPLYAYAAPTLSDSTSVVNSGMEYFFISALTSNPNLFYDSNIDSGYSVDNIPPVPPAGLTATPQSGPQTHLVWDSPADPDVGHYDVYRSTTSNFTPSPALKVGTATTVGYTDGTPVSGRVYHYRIVAVDVHGNQSQPSGEASAAFPITQTFAVNSNWNMISLPLLPSDFAKTELYPTAISEAFAYEGSYMVSSTLQNGMGYWLRFSGSQSISITGTLISDDTIGVNTGWNLIGSVSVPVPVASIGSSSGGLVTSQFFGYSGGYTTVTSLEPGSGYWVKVSGPGKLILGSTASNTAKISIRPILELPPPPPDGTSGQMPKEFSLQQNYPNPFNPTTTITYAIPAEVHVRLSVYNILGEEVMELVNENQGAGDKTVTMNAATLPSGIYTYRLTAGTFSDVKKMILIK